MKMLLTYIALCALIIIFDVISRTSAMGEVQSFTYVEVIALRGKLIHSTSSEIRHFRSKIHCGVTCGEVGCISYFYNSASRICQINHATVDPVTDGVQTMRGWRLYSRKEINTGAIACPPGTKIFNEGGKVICYYKTNEMKNAPRSSDLCGQMFSGGKLAYIPNPAAWRFILHNFTFIHGHTTEVWVGVNDEGREGDYRDADGDVQSFLPWDDNQPSDDTESTTQDCVRFYPYNAHYHYKWHDKPCSTTSHEAMCSINIIK